MGSSPSSQNCEELAVKPVLIAACGNGLAGDDGFGPRVAALLRELWDQESGIEVTDMALGPAELLDQLPDRRAVIVVDAVMIEDGEAGQPELLDVDCSDVTKLPLVLEKARSSHDLGLAWHLTLAQRLGYMPRHVRLVGLAIPARQQPMLGERMSRGARILAMKGARLAWAWAQKYLAEAN